MFIIMLVIVTGGLVATAAYFSIVGIASIFAYNYIAAMILGLTLEAGKISVAVYLYRFWALIPGLFKSILLSFMALLMFITSVGIFGFLSQGYQKTSEDQRVLMLELNNRIESGAGWFAPYPLPQRIAHFLERQGQGEDLGYALDRKPLFGVPDHVAAAILRRDGEAELVRVHRSQCRNIVGHLAASAMRLDLFGHAFEDAIEVHTASCRRIGVKAKEYQCIDAILP